MHATDYDLPRLQELEAKNSFPEPNCRAATEFVDTNQVNLVSLLGLWYVLGAFLVLAVVAGVPRTRLLHHEIFALLS